MSLIHITDLYYYFCIYACIYKYIKQWVVHVDTV